MTYGHSKARRPVLKQLLSILTVSSDGGVPLYFTTSSGNVTDDDTHRETWDLLRELVGSPEFLYVADCKLAARENLQYIHNQGGRFITSLPRTRREDREFRQQLLTNLEAVKWEPLYDVTNTQEEVVDRLRVCQEAETSSEGFRLLWFHSTRKAERDARRRARALERVTEELANLQNRLQSPKTRFRTRDRVKSAVDEILASTDVSRWLSVPIQEFQQEKFKQASLGRPNKDTQYVREVETRYKLSWIFHATRRLLDLFDMVQRHQLTGGGQAETFVTQLTPLQREIAKWFGITPSKYGRRTSCRRE